MRKSLILFPMLLCATPALAAPPAPQVPRELTDPATAERLANAMQAMSKAFLDLPIGEMKAALEGRQATASDKRLTVRDLGRREDPEFDRKFNQQMASARPVIEQSTRAVTESLPALMNGLQQMQNSLERAVANMPDPTYPKR